MQETVLLKSDNKVHAVLGSKTITRCGRTIRELEADEWNENSISCPQCLSLIERQIADEFAFFKRMHPEVLI